MTARPSLPPIEVANAARAEAIRLRAEWLIAVADGRATTGEVLAAACQPGGKPLRRIRLSALLEAQPGWGPARARRVVNVVTSKVGIAVTATPTVGWLVNRRYPHRLDAWSEVVAPDEVPWPDYPTVRAAN